MTAAGKNRSRHCGAAIGRSTRYNLGRDVLRAARTAQREDVTRENTEFVLIVEPGFTMQAFSSAIEVLRLARKLGGAALPRYSVAAMEKGLVRASNGIAVQVDHGIADLPRHAILIVVSGAGVHIEKNPRLITRLRRWAREGHQIWAVSSGVVRLAQAGLIDGARISAHWEDVPYLKENHPKVEVSTSLFIGGVKHSTCAGGGAVADLMLDFIRRNSSAELAEDIASRLILDEIRDGRLRQTLPAQRRYVTANKAVLSAIRLMGKNLHETLSTTEIARFSGVSLRQLERLFNAEFGKTPTVVYRELRLDEARQVVISGRKPLNEIAWDYGFQPKQFAKLYRRMFSVLPSEDRRILKP